MLLSELLATPGIDVRPVRPVPENMQIFRVCDDSRKVASDTLFVAVEGAVSDGHDYLESAYRLGCRAFICEKREDLLPKDAFVLHCDDTRKALALLSARILGNPADKMTLIGITGTKGKTTTALLLTGILRRAGINAGYIGSNGVQFCDVSLRDTKNTTPGSPELHGYLSAMLARQVTHVVLEISSQALYMSRVYGLSFKTVIYTNLAHGDHIGGAEHPDFEHYMNCKRSLFFDYNAANMVCNIDDTYAKVMLNPALRTTTVSMKADADYTARDATFTQEGGVLGMSAVCAAHGKDYALSLRLPGEFNIMNALCAAAAAETLGVSPDFSFAAMREITVRGRFECVPVAPDRYFVIDFAHNGLALRSVLAALKNYSPKRTVCVFGSVGGRTKSRRKALGSAAAELCDVAVLTADDPDYEPTESIIADILPSFTGSDCRTVVIPDREAAVRYALENSRPGDIVLFAGKGHEDFQLVRGTRLYFSEIELINKYRALIPGEDGAPGVPGGRYV